MRDLKAYYVKAMDIVTSIGAEPDAPIVEVTTLRANATRAWGKCERVVKNGFTCYTIKINRCLLDEAQSPDDALMGTMIHEILHTCAWKDDHTGRWLALANEINRQYGYNIKRTSSSTELGMSDKFIAESLERKLKSVKIQLICEKCGKVYLYRRESKFTRNYKACRCTLCRGSIRREDVFTA